MGHALGPPHVAASPPLPLLAPPLFGGAIQGSCPCPPEEFWADKAPPSGPPPTPSQLRTYLARTHLSAGAQRGGGKGRGDKIPLVVARPRARAACLQLGGALSRATPIQQKRMKRRGGGTDRGAGSPGQSLFSFVPLPRGPMSVPGDGHGRILSPGPPPAPGASTGGYLGWVVRPQRAEGPAPGPGRPPRHRPQRGRQRLATARLCLS